MIFSNIFSEILSLALRAMASFVLLEIKQFLSTILVFKIKVELQCLQNISVFSASDRREIQKQ